MQVMVLEQDQKRQAQLARALMEKGFHVLCVESLDAAECFIRMDVVDLLVLGERVGGRLSHSLALLAECRNPLVSAIVLTERSGPDMDELFDLIPAVYAILGRDVAPQVVTQVAVAAVTAQMGETPHDRTARRWQAAEAAGAQEAEEAYDDVPPRPAVAEQSVQQDGVQRADTATQPDRAGALRPGTVTAEPRAGAGAAPAVNASAVPRPAVAGPASPRWFPSGRTGDDGPDAVRAGLPPPTSNRPMIGVPVPDRPVPDGTVLDRPVLDRPMLDRPILNRPVLNRPMIDRPVLDGPVVAAPAGPLTDLPVFVPVALMGGDAPRRRLHLG